MINFIGTKIFKIYAKLSTFQNKKINQTSKM